MLPSMLHSQQEEQASKRQSEPRSKLLISNRPSMPQPSRSLTNPGVTAAQDGHINHNYQLIQSLNPNANAYASMDIDNPPSRRGSQLHQNPEHQQQITYMQPGYANYLPPVPTSRGSNYNLPYSRKHQGSFSSALSHSRPVDTSAMAILSSEQYDDRGAMARSIRRQQQEHGLPQVPFGFMPAQQQPKEVVMTQMPTKQQQQRRSTEDGQATEERRKKKQKLSSDDEGDDEAAKKARGRPRLDTKDETAADRRRTQIRMAQRAYRHRKETTISSLERQVQELRSANEQMSNIFIGLHDHAVGRGLLHREPEFGNYLKSTTERFLALAKSVQADENGKEEEGTSIDGSKQGNSDADPEHANHSTLSGTLTPQPPQPETQQPVEHTVWGYQVPKQDEQPNQISQMEWDQQPFMPLPRQDHQVISRATLDNASFSFDFLDNLDLQQFRAEVPDVADSYQNLMDVQKDLPLSGTLSQHETTFGRHLQRAALERGWKLINAKNPNPIHLNNVFGFCLRFETREEIASRIRRAIDSTSKDTLFEWKAPFVHLGGAGTHYPVDEGLSGTAIPKFRTGMSMGPFAPNVIRTRETAMFDDFRINIPGFEGEFFDANDVEGYLRDRGIDIPPNVEFVTVDLDLLMMNDMSSPETYSDSNTIKPYSPKTPKSPLGRVVEIINPSENIASQGEDYFNMGNTGIDTQFQIQVGGWNNQDESKTVDNIFSLTGPMFNSVSMSQEAVGMFNEEGTYQDSHVVTLSVTVLVEELLSKAACLGRAPGFRPSDVEAALRRALKKAF